MKTAAQAFGLRKGQIVVMIHTGSRGLGYQICDDYLALMVKHAQETGIELPDRQLACAYLNSTRGKNYLAAMACGANYAWANRQIAYASHDGKYLKKLYGWRRGNWECVWFMMSATISPR